jgi:hypothetical protein
MREVFALVRVSLASPARHPRTAVVLGRLLGAAFLICFATGLYSHFLQNPLPGQWFPTKPYWLYRLTQGTHVATGIACIPLLLGKLWTIFPLLFQWPAVRNLKQLLERASIALFVAGSLVEITIGLINTYQWYPWHFSFRQIHYALAWVVIASLAIHIGVKLPIIARWWRKRDSVDAEGHLLPVGPGEGELRPAKVSAAGITGVVHRWIDSAPKPDERIARRTVLAAVGLGSAGLVVTTAGQSLPLLDPVNVFAPRKEGIGPEDVPINKTAMAAGVILLADDPGWTLSITGASGTRALTRVQLDALTQTTVTLPIACVEGWSVSAEWTGVRFRDLARMVGGLGKDFTVQSLQHGAYARTILEANFVEDPRTLIALRLNGSVLTIDHGYPARLIAPARPGVLQTKWLAALTAR